MSHQEPNIFFQEKQETQPLDQNSKDLFGLQNITYLKRGDSNKYIEQFLVKEDHIPSESPSKNSSDKDENYDEQEDEEFQPDEPTETTPSSFHNFQKHLTICLKKSIVIQCSQASQRYEKVGYQMWSTFKSSNISTKKVLHYLLGEENEHKVTDQGLKEFKLKKIFDQNQPKVTKDARNYLAAQTLSQIKDGKLKDYIDSKKLKDKQKFRRYIQIFVQELNSGYLRKRLPKQKVMELSKC